MDGHDPAPSSPDKLLNVSEFLSILANVPGIVGATCDIGPKTGTTWVDIWLPGNKTIRIKATKNGRLLFMTNFESEE